MQFFKVIFELLRHMHDLLDMRLAQVDLSILICPIEIG